jgi:parvulin-like peptidyl-prolyl isomerase
MKPSLKVAAALAAGAIILTGCQKGADASSEATAATINGISVSQEEFVAFMQTKPTVRVIAPDGQVVEMQVADSYGLQVMQDLVAGKIILALAEEAGLAPTEDDIENEIKFRQGSNPTYVEDMKAKGFSLPHIKREIKLQLSQERIQTRGITIPMGNVDAYIEANPEQFVKPESVQLQVIYVQEESKMKEADAALKAGQDFTSVQQMFDETPPIERQTMGQPGGIPVDSLYPEMKAAIDVTEVSQTTTWVQSPGGGWAICSVMAKHEQSQVEITDTMKRSIQRQLAITQGQQANDMGRIIAEQMRIANVEINHTELQKIWEGFEKKMASVPPQGAVPPAGTTPPAGDSSAAPPTTE